MSESLNSIEKQRLAELEHAFELFNQTSLQLTQAYEALQHQVADLQRQLADSDQERLRVAERLERLLTLLPAGVIVLNEQNVINEMNDSAAQILGHDALGREWGVVVKNVFLSSTDAQELIKHDKTVYQLSEKSLAQNQGKILLIQDVTEARQLQEHISRHQRLSSMGEMAASLAHQIRTPLSSALLYVSQMGGEELSAEKRQKFVNKTLSSLHHLESLVKDMLQYAKGGRTQNTSFDLVQLFFALQNALEAQLQHKDLEVHYPKGYDETIQLIGDLDAIVTALQNLVMNAESVTQGRAVVKIDVAHNRTGFIDFIIVDNGPGIPEDLHEKIFEPFFTKRAKGTGLGLAVVRAVAEAHGGECWVNSLPGKGARFIVRLPLLQPHQPTVPSLIERSDVHNDLMEEET